MPSVYSNHLLADENQYQRVGLAAPKNLIINGDFSIWQRGTSSSNASVFLPDRWYLDSDIAGGTLTWSRQAFTLGQTEVEANPIYYNRIDWMFPSGGTVYELRQKIEDVRRLSSSTITITFYAKAAAAFSLPVNIRQDFGTGGSPSLAVTTLAGTAEITTSWTKYEYTVTLPSIAGKTLGTNDNSATTLVFDLLSQRFLTHTFDVANVQVEIGDTATDFEYVSPADQLARCKRYFERIGSSVGVSTAPGHCESTTTFQGVVQYAVKKRAIPNPTYSGVTTFVVIVAGSNPITTNISNSTISEHSHILVATTSGLTAGHGGSVIIPGGDFIDIDAEL